MVRASRFSNSQQATVDARPAPSSSVRCFVILRILRTAHDLIVVAKVLGHLQMRFQYGNSLIDVYLYVGITRHFDFGPFKISERFLVIAHICTEEFMVEFRALEVIQSILFGLIGLIRIQT